MTSPKAVNSGQTEREALLPCPFCGDKAEYKHNSLHGDESMAVCRCCGAQAFWSKWQARALLASKPAAIDALERTEIFRSNLQRTREQWEKCDPEAMSKMSQAAVFHALNDAKRDVLMMHALLAAQSPAPASPSGEDAPEWLSCAPSETLSTRGRQPRSSAQRAKQSNNE